MKSGAEDVAPDGAGKLFLTGCYKDFAPNVAGRQAKEKGAKIFASDRMKKSQRDLIIQPSVGRRSRPTLGGRCGWNTTLKGLQPMGGE